MNLDSVEKIANAVLYEGYLLYPYRSTSIKNQQRWSFGVLHPPAFCESQQAGDASSMQTECLIQGNDCSLLNVKVRFLHLLPDTAIPRDVMCEGLNLNNLTDTPHQLPIRFPDLEGLVEISAARMADSLFKVTIRILNLTSFEGNNRDAALSSSFISTHTILGVEEGVFISAIDPPEQFSEVAKQCFNVGTWPVLVGAESRQDAMLAAPIILYDYPKIATQSPGDLFDGTEIDEILTLRILTLTDEEKQQMRHSDEHVRALLQRTEALTSEQLLSLHGTMQSESKPGFQRGQRVRLRPSGRADVFDIALQGQIATVESVETNFEDQVYVTVTVDADPGQDLGRQGKPGHRFFFRPDEVEPL